MAGRAMTDKARAAVLSCARGWIDTPYRHQASVRGVGCDCLGLVRGIWRELYGEEPEAVPNYTPDWAEKSDAETLLSAAQRWLLPQNDPQAGDVFLFRLRPGVPCKHVGIVGPNETVIHAYWGRSVVSSWLDPFWRRRIAFAFSFPPLPDAAVATFSKDRT